MSVPPSEPSEITADQEGELQILGVDDTDMDAVFEALSSSTARQILAAIYDTPGTPSELADRTGNSIQTVAYHLDELRGVDLIRVADTKYSEKGKEMDVYAPADDPVVVFVGTEKRKTRFLDRLKRFIGAAAILFVASFMIFFSQFDFVGAGSGTGGAPTHPFVSIPGLEFLAGGVFVLGLIVLWWIWTR